MEATAGWVEEGEPGEVGCSTQVVARTDDDLTADDRARQGSHVECIAGALTISDYRHHLTTAGFIEELRVRPTAFDGWSRQTAGDRDAARAFVLTPAPVP